MFLSSKRESVCVFLYVFRLAVLFNKGFINSLNVGLLKLKRNLGLVLNKKTKLNIIHLEN